MTEAPPEADPPPADPPPTDQAPTATPPVRGSVFEAVRPGDDRVVAGVCAGVARQLGIDPVILRVAVGVLTLVGLSGAIIYAVAWVVLPDEATGRSVAQDHLGVKDNEPQIRGAALVVGGILALVSGFGLVGEAPWDTPFPYIGLLSIAGLWWWVIRPHQRAERERRTAAGPVPPPPPPGDGQQTLVGWGGVPGPVVPPRPVDPRHDGGRLTWATLALALVATGVLGVLDATGTSLPWSAYPAAALGVIGVGMLVGTVFGNARPLVLPAVLVGLALAVATALPTPTVGQRTYQPADAASVRSTYELGVGSLRLDLTGVSDPDALTGREVRLQNGLGEVVVTVPRDLAVSVEARSRAGQVDALGRRVDGSPTSLDVPAPAGTPHLRLVVGQNAGQIEVIRR
ncbi:PspC domain-containing protein [Solicola sp. PLA-1-18]|uniref:PspC domain-containing protein n=1 Tax=Solicola sp. PLA-1-18 TaxID=3380532 RepID=UPI003B7B763E